MPYVAKRISTKECLMGPFEADSLTKAEDFVLKEVFNLSRHDMVHDLPREVLRRTGTTVEFLDE